MQGMGPRVVRIDVPLNQDRSLVAGQSAETLRVAAELVEREPDILGRFRPQEDDRTLDADALAMPFAQVAEVAFGQLPERSSAPVLAGQQLVGERQSAQAGGEPVLELHG